MDQTILCDICGAQKLLPKGGDDQNNATTSLISAPLEGERRQVTIIFADISGFTALNNAAKSPAEVEQVVRLINLCLEELSEAIYEFDGYIDKYIGDAIMAVFGAPRAHEDDPERALRAALSMQARLEKFNEHPPFPLTEPLGIHMGINTGTVIAGLVGTERKRSYTVMGDAVNVASRLEGVSERGEILVSETTYNLTNRLFTFEGREPVKVKGIKTLLRIYDLKAARDLSQTQRGLSGMESDLIGREYEIRLLKEHYQKLGNDNTGSIVVLTGEAGLGKSRLIKDFRRDVEIAESENNVAHKPRWLFGRGLSYRQSFANRLFVDVLHSYLDLPQNPDGTLVKLRLQEMGKQLFGTRRDEVMPYLATLLGLKLDEEESSNLPLNDPQMLQQRTFIAVGEWVEALVEQQPLVMVFEDLHWADPSSVALINYLFSLTVRHRLLMICVTRPDRDSTFWPTKLQSAQDYPDNFDELILWPLTDEESRQLIKDLLQMESIPEALEHLLLNRAEGNPLFLEEVLRSLIEEGTLKRDHGQWHITRAATEIDIPNTLQGVLTARIDRLDESVKRVLQIAAVIGRVFPSFVLKPIVNEPDILEKALEQLEVAELIEVRGRTPEPEYMFKHVLTYETAYNSLLHQQRVMIHKQIGDYMSRLYWELGEEYAAIVADHYVKGETWPRAFRYLHRAADAAIQSFANQQALEFYNRALEVARRLGDEADHPTLILVYEGRARVLARLGRPQHALDDYTIMRDKARTLGDKSAQMRALNGVGALRMGYYDFPSALPFFEEALDLARTISDEPGMADTLNQLGNYYYSMGELDHAIQVYREASDISRALEDERRRIEAEDGLAKVIMEQGEIKAGLDRYHTEIIHSRRRLGYRGGLLSSLAALLMGQVYTGDYVAAKTTYQEVLELQQRSGDIYHLPVIKYYHGLAQLFTGDLSEAHDNLAEGLALAVDQKHRPWQLLGLGWLAHYHLNIGAHEAGLDYAEQSVEIADDLGSPLYKMRSQLMLGSAYRHMHRTDEAIKELEQAGQTARNMGLATDEVFILYQLTRSYMQAEAWDKAETSHQRLAALVTASDMREYVVRAYWLQSMLHLHAERFNDALDILIHASTLAEQIDSRLSQYVIQIQKAYIYHTSGNNAASRDAVIYAQKIQTKLTDALADTSHQTAFLNNDHAASLHEMTIVNAPGLLIKDVPPVGEAH